MSMKSSSRGFFSIDAVFALGLILFISASFLNLYEGRKAGSELTGIKFEAKLAGEELAAGINTVYANGHKFELHVKLPENLRGYQYLVTFDNSTRTISIENSAWGTISTGVICKNVQNFTFGSGELENWIRIYWTDNQVEVVVT